MNEQGLWQKREREISPPSSLSNVLLFAFRCSASPALSSCDGIVLHADESSIPPCIRSPLTQPTTLPCCAPPNACCPITPQVATDLCPNRKKSQFHALALARRQSRLACLVHVCVCVFVWVSVLMACSWTPWLKLAMPFTPGLVEV